jgi:hypothetical protein
MTAMPYLAISPRYIGSRSHPSINSEYVISASNSGASHTPARSGGVANGDVARIRRRLRATISSTPPRVKPYSTNPT